MWAAKDYRGFYAHYARHRDLGLDAMADEVLELAGKQRMGKTVKRKESGHRWICPKCEQECRWQEGWKHSDLGTPLCEGVDKPDKQIEYELETRTGDIVDRSRLDVDTRKWYLSKLAPKRYGDRPLEFGGSDRLHELIRAADASCQSGTPADDASE